MRPDLKLTDAQSMLCNVLGGSSAHARAVAAVRLQQELGDGQAFALAQANRVTPTVAHAIIDAFGLDQVSDHWRKAHHETMDRISTFLAELDRVACCLAEAGVPCILIENGALAKAVHPCPGCFDFGDLDLLVRQKDLPVIHSILTARGYAPKSTTPPSASVLEESNGRVEYESRLTTTYSLRLNLQWTLVARRWFDIERETDLEGLMQHSLSVKGCAVRVLRPEDNLLQLALHNASHAYVRSPGISLHLDIDRFVRRTSIQWQEFLGIAESLETKTRIYLSLALPKALFGTPIPDRVLDTLHPPPWKEQLLIRWIQRAGLFNPDQPKFGRLGYILFTALLYDDWSGLWRAIFPDRQWMQQQYGFQGSRLLPYYYGRRLFDLAFRRLTT